MKKLTRLLNILKHSKSKILSFTGSVIRLGKFPVIIPVSLTAFTGYFIVRPFFGSGIIMVSLGVLLLAYAASALNQVQESDIDSEMSRTRKRPIPSGEINSIEALIIILTSLLGGTFILWQYGNLSAVFLGLFTLVWYNGIYTTLKRVTPFAAVPGSVTGAIPPLIGWVAAGGNVSDTGAILLAAVFFMGQVPHFWLLTLKYGRQYSTAGLPAMTGIFDDEQIKRLSFTWVSASLAASLLLIFFGVIRSKMLALVLLISAVMTIVEFRKLIQNHNDQMGYDKKYFIILNSYYLLMMILLVTDRILS